MQNFLIKQNTRAINTTHYLYPFTGSCPCLLLICWSNIGSFSCFLHWVNAGTKLSNKTSTCINFFWALLIKSLKQKWVFPRLLVLQCVDVHVFIPVDMSVLWINAVMNGESKKQQADFAPSLTPSHFWHLKWQVH